ncbi:MAG TPA: DUF992 domain-containing protein [Pseudolabrys sp.]|nr:DUF992 domain-containing protein [Pseudolabrys sp.]
MYCHRLLLATLALTATLAEPTAAQAPQSWTLAGSLDCKVDPNVGFSIPGHQSMRCLFTPTVPISSEAYAGALNTLDQNPGINAGSVFGFVVLAPTTGLSPGALAGEYVGVSGDAGIGVGAGPSVLLGGSNRTVALQPSSLQGSITLNVVTGLSLLKLRPLPN